MAKAGTTHDITIATVSGTALGFMLWRDRRGRRGFRLHDSEALAPRVLSMGDLTEAESPTLVAQYASQTDWRGGLGGDNHANAPNQLAVATKTDATVRGKILPARELKVTTVDSVPDQYIPSGFASGGTISWAFMGQYPYQWDYTNKDWDRGTSPMNANICYKNGVEYSGRTYAAGWLTTPSPEEPFALIHAATGATSWADVAPGWCPKYLAVANNKLWGGYWRTRTVNAATIAEDVDISETRIDLSAYGGGAVGDFIVIDDEIMEVTGYSTVGAAFVDVVRAQKGSVAATHANGANFYKLDAISKHTIRSATAPTAAANWSSAVEIGDSSAEITAVLGDDNDVIICKEDGVYRYTAGAASPVVSELRPEMKAIRHVDNGRGAFMWNDKAIIPLGAGGFLELNTSDWTFRHASETSLEFVLPDQTELHGRMVAFAGEPRFLYALVLDETNTDYHLLQADWLTIGGTTDYRWHHVATVGYTTSHNEDHAALMVSGVSSGTNIHHRVWVGVHSTGSNLLPYFYPQADDIEDGYTNDTDVVYQTVKIDKNLPKVDATWAEVIVESANLGAGGRQLAVEYRLDAGSWLTTLTDASGNADGIVDTSPDQTMTFPAGTTGKILELRFKPALTTVGTTAAELRYFRVKYQLRPSVSKLLPLDLYLAADQPLLNGANGGRPKLDLAQLETWDSQAAEVTVVDARGTSRSMVFLPGQMKVEEVAHEATSRPEYRVRGFLMEV